jgi:phosphomannomutase
MKNSHKLKPSILRAYDIRGIVGESLFEQDAFYIGKAYASKIIKKTNNKNPKVAVGRDGRLSSPTLHQQLVNGMVSAGAIVTDIGIGPTPMLYFSVRSLKLDGGIMITGSHNPPSHNGFKMMYAKAPLFAEEITELGAMIEQNAMEENVGGSVENFDIKNDYVKVLLAAVEDRSIDNLSNMRVAWDPGNGAGGEITKLLTQKLSGQHFVINDAIDGTFPAHHPDPSEEKNLKQLKDLIKKYDCHIGIAFDGDADRIGAVDGEGKTIFGDQMMMIFAEDVLENNKGAKIIVDVKTSESFFDKVIELGGEPIMWKTGHSFIKNKMAETGAALAGEMSGHIFFADKYFGYDDAIYSAVRLLNFFAKKSGLPSAYIDTLPKSFSSSEYRIEVREEDKFRIVEEIRAKVKASGKKVSEIDGIRVKEENGWWLLRSSNTQAVISIRAESTSETGLNKIKSEIVSLLKPYGIKSLD